ncbi:MAG: ATP-binding protein [Spirochaetaceae bacterium]|nr:ATP-binding protein [Spirochaetaceae bacterium]
MEKYIVRTKYLESLKELQKKNLVKVITGIRRSGKSVLMEQFQEYLKSIGVKQKQIISLNFEKLENEELLDYKKLHDYVAAKLSKNGWTYVFLDEIQMVDNFQKAVGSLHTKKNVDLYITGSNSYLLSGELATLLTGRYMQIRMQPFSFEEFTKTSSVLKKGKTVREEFVLDYLRLGGFPQVVDFTTEKAVHDYLDDVLSAIIRKDILSRERSVNVGVLESITKFLFHNIGSEVSSVNIANTLKSNKREASYNTVEKYLNYLKDSFVIYEVGRYDIKGKQHLKQNAKYYAVDIGLRNMLLANKETDIGHVLENVIYLELLRRGYKISVGKVESKEVDFVAENENGKEYYQVVASLLDKKTLERELAPLNRIKDHFPKFIITLDDYAAGATYNGIRIIHAIDFLLQG